MIIMMMMKKILRLSIILSILLIAGCGKIKNNNLKHITVSIAPQKYFVKRIAGNRYPVNVMIPPGSSPAIYEPSPRQIKELSRSFLYFKIGYLPFEFSWMNKLTAANKNMRVIDTSRNVRLIHSRKHHHGGNNKRGIDPHIWLSPESVMIQAKNILKAFTDIDSKNREFYQKNYNSFIRDIKELDNRIKTKLKKISKRKFLVFHPVWGYFARDYNLTQIAIEVEGKSPGLAGLKKLLDMAKKEGIKVIFVQRQFDTRVAGVIASEIGGEVVSIDPLEENWLFSLRRIADVFVRHIYKKN